MKTVFKNPIDACRAIEARFEGKLPEPGKHIRLMHCDSRTGNRSVCLNVYADARGGYLYSFRDGISVEWRWSDADKQKYLKNCLTLREEVPALSSNAKLVKKLLKKAKPIKKHSYLESKHLRKYENYPLYEISRQSLNNLYSKELTNCLVGDRFILVPLLDIGGHLHSAQLIDEEGRKRFLKGKIVKSFFTTQELSNAQVIGIAEGVATALSVTQVEGFPVVAAMSCTRFRTIVPLIKKHYPQAKIIVLGDCGHGETEAKSVALSNNVPFVSPSFSEEQIALFKKLTRTTNSPTDFNDYYVVKGILYE